MIENEIDALELELLLQAINKHYGYDFHEYAEASMLRRIDKHLARIDLVHISELIPLLLHDQEAFDRFVKDMSVVVTELFRNPDFFQALRRDVMPILRTYPFIKIWHAGCASGQEVYSMAILLEEEGLLERCQIYATDFNEHALETARQGIYSHSELAVYEQNYQLAGGKGRLSDYYTELYDSVKFSGKLAERITFANHNLVTDGVFGEMNLVLCRNVLIYFNKELQNRVLELLLDSLSSFGVLCIGRRENLRFSSIHHQLEVLDQTQRIYRKIGQ